jgi:hypothetical protein
VAPLGPRKRPERKVGEEPKVAYRDPHRRLDGRRGDSSGQHARQWRGADGVGVRSQKLVLAGPRLRLFAAMPCIACRARSGCNAAPKLRGALKGESGRPIEIIKRSDAAHGFEAMPRRRGGERTDPWLRRSRRPATARKASLPSTEAWLLIAYIIFLSDAWRGFTWGGSNFKLNSWIYQVL